QRFVLTHRVAPQLHHNNLLTIYGAGRTGAYCWLAREHVEGESLAGLVARLKDGGKFTWSPAARVAGHLARALAVFHEHKIVHGNITPKNVLIRSSDKLTKLADLMLAKALEGSKLELAIAEKKLRVELPYMAPEQTRSETLVDHLTDLYSVGAVVYLLLVGQP